MSLEKELEHRSEYLAGGQHALLMALKIMISVLSKEQKAELLLLLQANQEPLKVALLNSSSHEDYVKQFEHVFGEIVKFAQ